MNALFSEVNPIHSTLTHHLLLPRTSGEKPAHPAMVFLHGRGANEDDLLGLTGFLSERLLVISPRAPFSFPYSDGYTWYDFDETGRPDPVMFQSSFDALSRFIEDILTHYPVDRDQLFLFGFSMGAMMAFALSLTAPNLAKGVIAHSGYVPEKARLNFQWGAGRTSYFVAHGTHDPVIPVESARRTRDLLEKSGKIHVYREYPIGHEISHESLNDVSAWVNQILGEGD
jgi:phospholipase/carboxylesterase